MPRVRSAVIVAAALGLTGCAELVGVDDPVVAFPISPLIEGDYLLGMDARNTSGLGEVYQFKVTIVIEDFDDRTTLQSWTALEAGGTAVGSEIVVGGVILANDDQFEFELAHLETTIPAAATTGGFDVQLREVFLDATFPILRNAERATRSGFCGSLEGSFTEQGTDGQLRDVTFAAFKIEVGVGEALPTAKTSCAELDDQ